MYGEFAIHNGSLADVLGISQSYTEKLVQLLRQVRLLGAVRGMRGGYVPEKDPKDISVAAVFYSQPKANADVTNAFRQTEDFRNCVENIGRELLAKVTVADVMTGNFHSRFSDECLKI